MVRSSHHLLLHYQQVLTRISASTMKTFLLITAAAYFLTPWGACQQDDPLFKKYKFDFKTGDSGDHTRQEESDGSGRVSGMYSYVDPNGVLRTVKYDSAPGTGFRAYGDGILQIASPVEQQLPSFNAYSRNFDVREETRNLTSEENDTVVKDDLAKDESVIDEVILSSNDSSFENSTNNEAGIRSPSVSSSSVVINHGNMVPMILPYNPYRMPLHYGPFLFTVPNAFTYNFAAPHYRIIL